MNVATKRNILNGYNQTTNNGDFLYRFEIQAETPKEWGCKMNVRITKAIVWFPRLIWEMREIEEVSIVDIFSLRRMLFDIFRVLSWYFPWIMLPFLFDEFLVSDFNGHSRKMGNTAFHLFFGSDVWIYFSMARWNQMFQVSGESFVAVRVLRRGACEVWGTWNG